MQSINVKAFLSHKFDDRIIWLVELVESICESLNISCENVNHSSSDLPIDEAKNIIENSHFLIALCTQDNKFSGKDEYSFSTAVQQEITIAHQSKKPIVIFAEKGVVLDGFLGNMCTYSKIDIENGLDKELVENLVKGIHLEKVKSIHENQFEISQEGVHHFYIDKMESIIKLIEDDNGNLMWHYITEKKYMFTSKFQLPLKFGAWPMSINELDDQTEKTVTGTIEILENSKTFECEIIEDYPTNNSIEFSVNLHPFPSKDDFIKIRSKFSSPHFNIMYSEGNTKHVLDFKGVSYNSIDGKCLINRCKELDLKLIFPSGYFVDIEEIVPIVGTFTTSLDYVIERETERIKTNEFFKTKVFDDQIEISLNVTEPLYQHFYGFVWNAPKKKG